MSQTYPQWPETNFPDSLDSFKEYINVLASDGPVIQKYLEAMYVGNQTLAQQYLSQIPDATQKIITATDLNKLIQSLKAIEAFYHDDVEEVIATKQEEWETTINRFSYIGSWDSTVYYLINNMVSYTIDGTDYIFISLVNNNLNHTPSLTDTQYWRSLIIQGQKGTAGEGFPYAGYWSATTPYSVNDYVTYNGAVYCAIQPSTNIPPSFPSAYWVRMIKFEPIVFPIQNVKPDDLVYGNLWFNTSSSPSGYHYLSPLSSAATAADIVLGKQAYDQNGNLLVGTKT